MRKICLIVAILLFAIFLQAGLAFFASAQNAVVKVAPRIDDKAASTVREKSASDPVVASVYNKPLINTGENKYPMNFWVFLFGAYIFILIFNLAFDFEKTQKMHLFLEITYTFLAIFAWDKLDATRENPWFPRIVIETFALVYVLYSYFFKKKLTAQLT